MTNAAAVAAALQSCVPGGLGITKKHKLLYYCQAWHATWTGKPLFPETIEAWELGPVVAELWCDEKRRGVSVHDGSLLDEDEFRTVNYVASRYGRLSARQLVDQTHDEAPWTLAWDRGKNSEVEVDIMVTYFSDDPAADQAWFWDADWLVGEREADAQIASGDLEGVMSTEEFLASL